MEKLPETCSNQNEYILSKRSMQHIQFKANAAKKRFLSKLCFKLSLAMGWYSVPCLKYVMEACAQCLAITLIALYGQGEIHQLAM